MKSILYRANPIKYILMRYLSKLNRRIIYSQFGMAKLVDIPEPELITQEWVKIKVTLSGICGTDIASLSGEESEYLEPYVHKEFVLGHENVGIITQVGMAVKNLKLNDRVVVIPFLACKQRGIEEECKYCKDGYYALCKNVTSGKLSNGLGIGWNSITSGGWSEYFVAHESQVLKLPDTISDESAVMIDSFSCSLHAVLRNPPNPHDIIIIYGCGVMGLNTILALRVLGFKNKIIVIYSRNFQKIMALESGADVTISAGEDLFKRISDITNSIVYYLTIGKPVIHGGVNLLFDCVGNMETINNSLRFLAPHGRYVMVATTGIVGQIDCAPIWFKELSINGSCQQAREKYDGTVKSAYEISIDFIKSKKLSLEKFVTHKYPLERFKLALKSAINKQGDVIKVVLHP